jgi:hypothetical protein
VQLCNDVQGKVRSPPQVLRGATLGEHPLIGVRVGVQLCVRQRDSTNTNQLPGPDISYQQWQRSCSDGHQACALTVGVAYTTFASACVGRGSW